jgi:Grap2 and cyclin-D-interacting
MTPSDDKSSKDSPETPEAVQRALKSASVASTELLQTSKSILHSATLLASYTKSGQSSLDAIAKLASLIHSHTVRTALTCGPTASSPTATLNCVKDLHEPILPMISEFQNVTKTAEFPGFFVTVVSKEITTLLDMLHAFVEEVIEIASGDVSVESRERLQYSGMVMDVCDRLRKFCETGPNPVLRTQLRNTEEMLNDALEELTQLTESNSVDDGWDDEPIEYTPEQKAFAGRVQIKLKLLSFLYKAISKRRLPKDSQYATTCLPTLQSIHDNLDKLAANVDDLVSGICSQEDLMKLELSIIEVVNEAQRLARTIRLPLNGVEDGKESWFDTWLEKIGN